VFLSKEKLIKSYSYIDQTACCSFSQQGC